MDQYTPLYYLSAAGGLTMIVGGIWLIAKQKIYIDRETKQPTEIEIPIFGKLKTNTPALILFFLGLAGLWYPINALKSATKFLTVEGNVKFPKYPVTVYAVVQEATLQNDGSYNVTVPDLNEKNYTPVLVFLGGRYPFVRDSPVRKADQKNGIIPLNMVIEGNPEGPTYEPDIAAPGSEFKQ